MWIVSVCAVLLPTAFSFSTCDDIDVAFILNANIFESSNISETEIINSMIQGGSSEDACIGIAFYGWVCL